MNINNLNSFAGRVVVVSGLGDYTPEEIALINKCRFSVIEILARKGYDPIAFDVHEEEFFNSPEKIIQRIKKINPVFIFNLFEGFAKKAGSEADFVEMLENENLKFTGNGSAALRTCLDKYSTKKILTENGINSPYGALLKKVSDLSKIEPAFPAFVKPAFEDASLGICPASFVTNMRSLRKTTKMKLPDFSEGLLVEEFISGVEYNVGFFSCDSPELVGISALDYDGFPDDISFLNYSGKWDNDSAEYGFFMPRVIDPSDPLYREDVVDIGLKAGKLLGCSKHFRVDIREKDGILYVLDVNPNPDISPDSGFGRQALANDLTYEDVIVKIASSFNC